MKYDIKDTARRIRELRLSKNMTQEELSAALNLSRDYIGRVETTTRTCTLENLINIAMFFDCSLDYLVFGRRIPERLARERINNAIEVLESLRDSI